MKKIDQLREKGHRITSQRKAVIDSIGNQPISAEEIFDKLSLHRMKIDLASIYRSLDLFMKEEIIQEVNFSDGKKRYEKLRADNHHHHLVCNNCRSVDDIEFKESLILNEVKNKSKFKVEKHSLEFFGLCKNCQ